MLDIAQYKFSEISLSAETQRGPVCYGKIYKADYDTALCDKGLYLISSQQLMRHCIPKHRIFNRNGSCN